MEQDSPSAESDSSSIHETHTSPEAAATLTVDMLPERLGFVETAEFDHLRHQIIEAMLAGSNEATELATRYRLQAEEAVAQHKGQDFIKAQIGLLVQVGLIRRDGGNTRQYIADLQDALDYAEGVGFDEIAAVLEIAMATTIE